MLPFINTCINYLLCLIEHRLAPLPDSANSRHSERITRVDIKYASALMQGALQPHQKRRSPCNEAVVHTQHGAQVFIRERLNGYYGVSQFVMANTIAATPFVFLIAVLSSVTVYWLASLNPSGGSVIYFILDLFLALMVVSLCQDASLYGPSRKWASICMQLCKQARLAADSVVADGF